jgi:nucleoside-diphosphate-sugar epimerase
MYQKKAHLMMYATGWLWAKKSCDINCILLQAVQSSPPFDYVIHTASPYHLNVQDPVKDFLDPAIKGTTGILKSIQLYAPEVKRVVITSSSAAIINPGNHLEVYNESVWAPVTWEEAMLPQNTYRASKVNLCRTFF